jgi:hypothetical protein
MLFIRPDGTSPTLHGLKSATKRADGLVSATDDGDIAALFASGWLPFQDEKTLVAAFGEVTFDEGVTHLQLLPAVFCGTF